MQKKENLNQVKKLLTPPRYEPNNLIPNLFDESAQVGIPVSPFPTWVVCPQCRLLAPLKSGLFELKRDRHRPDQNRYIHSNCHKFSPTVIPARFLVACQHGHLDDFPWRYFVHKGKWKVYYSVHQIAGFPSPFPCSRFLLLLITLGN